MYATKRQLMSWLNGNSKREDFGRADLKEVIAWLNGETNQGVDKDLIAEGYGWIYDLRERYKEKTKIEIKDMPEKDSCRP
ncbi:MAG: hypothetical protein V1900_01110 [Candidatus Aenigmatarchaeota archaeon]